MKTSDTIDKIAPALVAAQSAMGHARKDGKNPHFKSAYATLTEVLDTALPALNAQGISLVQGAGYEDDNVTVTTRLQHSSGQWIESTAGAKPTKADPQGYGSCLTYLRRYGALAICGIGTEDDDGTAASRPVNLAELRRKATDRYKCAQANGKSSDKLEAWIAALADYDQSTLEAGIVRIEKLISGATK